MVAAGAMMCLDLTWPVECYIRGQKAGGLSFELHKRIVGDSVRTCGTKRGMITCQLTLTVIMKSTCFDNDMSTAIGDGGRRATV